ncbi:hypothetical protein [Gryllotalpicola protaetiae]|uniref:hypothetical protein n=1 Tax=Gryllotalpicola protaetiae TaxID=2419771 RepID=UPI0013C4D0BF|nr:hypothetical protein [Gryllotalpicola protaetiae]
MSEVAQLVLVSAISTALVIAAACGMPSVLPAEHADGRAKTGIVASGLLLAAVVIVGLTVTFALVGLLHFGVMVPAFVAVMLVSQAIYNFGIAFLVREGDFGSIARMRLWYGGTSAAFTLGACLLEGRAGALILASSASFLVGGLYGLIAKWPRLIEVMRTRSDISARGLVNYVGSHVGVIAGGLLDGVASQVTGIVIGSLGTVAGAWGVVTRVGGGFSTVGQQLVAPVYDIRFARAVRASAPRDAQLTLRSATGSGLGLGAIAVSAGIALAWVSGSLAGLSAANVAAVVAAATLYWGATVTLGPINKFLVMMGEEKSRATWALVRASAVVIILLALRDQVALLAIGSASSILTIVYILLVSRAISSRMKNPGFSGYTSSDINPRST